MGVERFKIPKTLDNPMRAIGMPIDSVIVGVVTWLLFFLFIGMNDNSMAMSAT